MRGISDAILITSVPTEQSDMPANCSMVVAGVMLIFAHH